VTIALQDALDRCAPRFSVVPVVGMQTIALELPLCKQFLQELSSISREQDVKNVAKRASVIVALKSDLVVISNEDYCTGSAAALQRTFALSNVNIEIKPFGFLSGNTKSRVEITQIAAQTLARQHVRSTAGMRNEDFSYAILTDGLSACCLVHDIKRSYFALSFSESDPKRVADMLLWTFERSIEGGS